MIVQRERERELENLVYKVCIKQWSIILYDISII